MSGIRSVIIIWARLIAVQMVRFLGIPTIVLQACDSNGFGPMDLVERYPILEISSLDALANFMSRRIYIGYMITDWPIPSFVFSYPIFFSLKLNNLSRRLRR
jgi:hypothetical protein